MGPGCGAEIEGHHQAEDRKDNGEDDGECGRASGGRQTEVERADVTDVAPSSENICRHT